VSHIHKTAPGPPAATAEATPTMLPVPMVAARAVMSEAKGLVYGVVKLTLRPGAYSWEFLPVAGASFHDAGSGTCH